MSDYTRPYNGKLYVYYLKLSDSGEYVCTAPDGRTGRVILDVYEEPKDGDKSPETPESPETPDYAIRVNLDRPSPMILRPGTSDEIVCTAMTNGPELEVEWYNPRGQVKTQVFPSLDFLRQNAYSPLNSSTAYPKQQTLRNQDIDNERATTDQSIHVEVEQL